MPDHPHRLARIERGTVAETVVLDLAAVLLGDGLKDLGLMNLIVRGEQHVPRCPRGQWLTPGGPRPDGDPCSARCRAARAALNRASAYLQAQDAARVVEEGMVAG